MSQYQFIKYEPTPTEKHLGIATVKLYGKIILRYKMVATKDGTGYFPAAASYKMPNTTDQYYSAFMLDSTSEREELEGFIKHHVKSWMAQQGLDIFGNPSVHMTNQQGQPVAQPGQQPNPNYGGYPQQQPFAPVQAPQVPFVQRPEYQQNYNQMPDMPPFDENKMPF